MSAGRWTTPRSSSRSTPRGRSRCGASSPASCATRSARGRLRTGVRLPASRALAAQLGVSRGVVTDAYEQLTAEGWLAARRGAGHRRRRGAGRRARAGRAAAPRGRALRLHPDDARRLAVPAPPVGARGRARRRRGARRRARLRQRLRQPRAARGARRLPRPRPRHRGRARAASSSARATARPRGCCSRVLAERGVRRVALEDPSLTDHWDAAAHAGLEAVPIALDGEGLRVDALAASGADAVVVTPEPPVPDRRGDGAGAPPRAARLGARRRPARDRGRLRRRVPLRPPAARRAAGARPRARRVRRHGVQDARARAAARLDPRAGGARAARSRSRSSPPTPARPRSTSSRSRT